VQAARATQAMIWIGIMLEILAAALGTLSKQLIAASEHLKKPWLFHTGASINIAVGPIVDASAYAFAPQVIIAPFACLDVIFNALTAPYTLHWQKEVLTKVHLIGCGFVALGASLTAVFADFENELYTVYELERQLLRPQSLIYFGIEISAILTVNWFLRKNLLSPMVRGISLGVIAGVLMGNVFFVKGIVSLVRHSISTGDVDAWLRPTPYICVGFAAGGAIVGHMFMRKGLSEYKGVFMVTIFEGAHISAACLSGTIVMSEMSGAPWWRYVCYWASVLVIVAGMCFINTAAADAKIGRSVHIAQHFTADEEAQNLKDGVAPAPVGRSASDAEELEFASDFGGPLDGHGSPISGASDFELDVIRGDSGVRERAKPKCENGETSSNVSTSTPEGDLFETHNAHNGNDDADRDQSYALPVFSGSV